LVSNWNRLLRYVEAGTFRSPKPRRERYLPLRLRPQELAVQRTPKGTTAGAQVHSLIETAKDNGQ